MQGSSVPLIYIFLISPIHYFLYIFYTYVSLNCKIACFVFADPIVLLTTISTAIALSYVEAYCNTMLQYAATVQQRSCNGILVFDINSQFSSSLL